MSDLQGRKENPNPMMSMMALLLKFVAALAEW
jgi:hypothetical protein